VRHAPWRGLSATERHPNWLTTASFEICPSLVKQTSPTGRFVPRRSSNSSAGTSSTDGGSPPDYVAALIGGEPIELPDTLSAVITITEATAAVSQAS
jgi:hypothetical protein